MWINSELKWKATDLCSVTLALLKKKGAPQLQDGRNLEQRTVKRGGAEWAVLQPFSPIVPRMSCMYFDMLQFVSVYFIAVLAFCMFKVMAVSF